MLEFAFDSREESDYLPHTYPRNCVVYTGTHDNETVSGWYKELNDQDRKFADDYLNLYGRKEEEIPMEFVRAALSSVADTAIIPVQDYLGLGERSTDQHSVHAGKQLEMEECWKERSLRN